MTTQVTEIVKAGGFDLAASNPIVALEKAQTVVKWMAEKCQGPKYIATISGSRYPKVDWWTTVGMSLGLFPVEVETNLLPREDETTYLSVVEVRYGEKVVTRASAICSSNEEHWSDRDEHAIRSMAITRATGKAYRIGLSGLAVMAGLEPTPAEEMTHDAPSTIPDTTEHWCEVHQVNWFKRGRMRGYAHPIEGSGNWCNEPEVVPTPEPTPATAAPTSGSPTAPTLTQAQLRAAIEAEGMTWGAFETMVLRVPWDRFIKREGATPAVALHQWGAWKKAHPGGVPAVTVAPATGSAEEE